VTGATQRIRVWDLPTRIFHWTLAVLVVFSFATGKIGGGWMAWHLKSGYAILALVLFRLAWGFVGSESARFARFLRGPRAALAYARDLLAGRHPAFAGHNPLGGWMVVAMLLAVLLQAATGLFSDDEIATQGPLAVKVANETVSRMSAIHSWWEWAIVALVVLHVCAIAAYRWKWNVRLAGAMLHGRMEAPGAVAAPRLRPIGLAAIVLAAAAAVVYVLVEIVPMR
jgi:cytochrome b